MPGFCFNWCCEGGYVCAGCTFPEADLTISWNNVFSGPGSATMVYNPPGQWVSAAVLGIVYRMNCNETDGVRLVLEAGGGAFDCATTYDDPRALQRVSFACSPLLLYVTCQDTFPGCPNHYANGYTDWTVSE